MTTYEIQGIREDIEHIRQSDERYHDMLQKDIDELDHSNSLEHEAIQSEIANLRRRIDALEQAQQRNETHVETCAELSTSMETQYQAEEAQCKRKEVIAAIEHVKAQAKQNRRFVVGWDDEEGTAFGVNMRKGTMDPEGFLRLDYPGRLKSIYGNEGELRTEIRVAYPKTQIIIFSFLD